MDSRVAVCADEKIQETALFLGFVLASIAVVVGLGPVHFVNARVSIAKLLMYALASCAH